MAVSELSFPRGVDDDPGLRVTAGAGRAGDTVVNLHGDLDYDTVPAMLRVIDPLLQRGESARVILNLAELGFLDSAGIKALLDCRSRAEAVGSLLVLSAPQPMVLRVLEITGVLGLLGLAPDETDRTDLNETG